MSHNFIQNLGSYNLKICPQSPVLYTGVAVAKKKHSAIKNPLLIYDQIFLVENTYPFTL